MLPIERKSYHRVWISPVAKKKWQAQRDMTVPDLKISNTNTVYTLLLANFPTNRRYIVY